MKKIFFLLLLFIISAGIFFSCKKELSCEECSEANKPPIAIAGPDQVITLPADSISLDGSASNDPDGMISSYLWKKISGPASFSIVNAVSVRTIVRNLDTGVYRFELKVKDNGNLSATDTVQITVTDPGQPNRPPVANAGSDTTITLPANTVNLDGSRSTDPDNNITSYAWAKISGPSSFTISNANAVQTQVTNLVEGAYQFELKVTDAGGLFSKDTMQVNVNINIPQVTLCDNSNRPNINAQLVSMATLSGAPWAVVSVGNKLAFIGLDSIDIYDLTLNTWSKVKLNLSLPRYLIAVIGAGNKIFFAGGDDGLLLHDVVDIYDISNNTWTVSHLSRAGDSFSATVCGNKVFFTGGNQGIYVTNKVDIYNLTTDTWSTASLSGPRNFITAVSSNRKVYFTGGDPWSYQISNIIDIYDNASNSWSTSTMQIPRVFHAGVVVDDILYLSGGNYPQTPTICSVETLNTITGDRTLMNLFGPAAWWTCDGQNAVPKDNKIIFLRQNGGADANRFDIYDIQPNSWSTGVLPQPIPSGAKVISINNTIYIAGGYQNTQVWKLEF